MKKTYITPQVEIVKIQPMMMLITSDDIIVEGLVGLDGYVGIDEEGEVDPD